MFCLPSVQSTELTFPHVFHWGFTIRNYLGFGKKYFWLRGMLAFYLSFRSYLAPGGKLVEISGRYIFLFRFVIWSRTLPPCRYGRSFTSDTKQNFRFKDKKCILDRVFWLVVNWKLGSVQLEWFAEIFTVSDEKMFSGRIVVYRLIH